MWIPIKPNWQKVVADDRRKCRLGRWLTLAHFDLFIIFGWNIFCALWIRWRDKLEFHSASTFFFNSLFGIFFLYIVAPFYGFSYVAFARRLRTCVVVCVCACVVAQFVAHRRYLIFHTFFSILVCVSVLHYTSGGRCGSMYRPQLWTIHYWRRGRGIF